MERDLIFRPLDVSDSRFLAEYAVECEGRLEGREISGMKILEVERRLRRRFEDPNYIGVIALLGDERVGFQDGVIVNQSLELNEIYVREKYRHKRIGEGLLKEIILMAKARGVKKILFHTEPDNIAMRCLGEKVGFTLTRLTYEKEL